ncbi:MAG: DUF547 domain-containing protein [Alphaproteobacteria bacterium]|nr:DUF547 domain-containing protein [Alphaproteobacteria bacterium]
MKRRARPAVLAALLGAVLLLAGQIQPTVAGDVTQTFTAHEAGSKATVDHSEWTRMLGKYVVPGADGVNRVDYSAWKSDDHKALKAYVKRLEATDPRKLDRAEQFAFWANLYNSKTIEIVLDHLPIKSIREISINEGLFGFIKKSVGAGGPWKAKIINVLDQKLSLDDIEHKIMRPIFKDPRVHYSVNCASFGCPNLGTQAFTGQELDGQLDANAKAFVNNVRGIQVNDGYIWASSIYQWFQEDFGGTQQGVLDHVRKYAKPGLAAKLEGKSAIDSYGYDWKLNDINSGS